MKVPDVVLDTNGILAALRSSNGASNKLLSLVGTSKFGIQAITPGEFLQVIREVNK